MFLALILALMPMAVAAQDLSGPVSVTDGDSFSMTETRIRLFGIDAPERDQTCQREGKAWACGKAAADHLAGLTAGKTVRCIQQDRDRYGRIVARCNVERLDLADLMVRSGLAVALPQFTEDYAGAETRARQLKLGLWGGEFDTPAAWRAAHPRLERAVKRDVPAFVAAPARQVFRNDFGCAIKGNRNRKGQWIYHLPGMPYYDRTRAEEMFCTEQQAVAAGYRRAIVQP